MHNTNRDLLVITKNNMVSQQELEQTIMGLHSVLFKAENFAALCQCHEVFDINKFKVITKHNKVAWYIANKSNKPYIFICNKN